MIIVFFVDEFHLERDLSYTLYVGKTPASHAAERPAALELHILFTLGNKSVHGIEHKIA